MKLILFQLFHYLFLLVVWNVVSNGYVFMNDDLSRAVSQFYPSTSGGMSGGPGTPPGPSGDPFFPLASPHLNEPGVNAEALGHPNPSSVEIENVEIIFRAPSDIADLLRDIFHDLRTHVPGGFQAERLAEMLEERYGPERMPSILESLQTHRGKSPYFREIQTDFSILRGSGGTEKQLRAEWRDSSRFY